MKLDCNHVIDNLLFRGIIYPVSGLLSQGGAFMTKEGVKKVVSKLITDESFKQTFFKNPTDAIKTAGYDVDDKETAALAKIRPEDVVFEVNEKVLGEGTVAGNTELTVSGIKSFKQLGAKTKIDQLRDVKTVDKVVRR